MTSDAVWERPLDKVPFPHVWLEFTAKESSDSDKLVKYRIQDLPEDRIDDAIQHAVDYYLKDGPMPALIGVANDKAYIEDYFRLSRIVMAKKMSLVCMREGSDKILGVSTNFLSTKNDTTYQDAVRQGKSEAFKTHMAVGSACRGNVNIYEKYGVEKYLGCCLLSVSPANRGLRICERLLEARKPFCKAFDIALTHTFFTSDASNHIADKMVFETDVEFTRDELCKMFPELHFENLQAGKFALRSLKMNNYVPK